MARVWMWGAVGTFAFGLLFFAFLLQAAWDPRVLLFMALFLAVAGGQAWYFHRLHKEAEKEAHGGDFETRLRKLEALRRDELVSEDEYARKRREILDDRW